MIYLIDEAKIIKKYIKMSLETSVCLVVLDRKSVV